MAENRFELWISKQASKELARRPDPLYVEMELLFSCLIRKRVLFMTPHRPNGIDVPCADNRLRVRFRPVMTKVCMMSGVVDVTNAEVEGFSVHRKGVFTPKWLRIDLKKGSWVGDFGWTSPGG